MDIRKGTELPQKLIRPQAPGGESSEGAHGIMPGGCFPPKKLPIDRDRLEFTRRDSDRSGSLTSDEYGVGKAKQDEFRRYDRNHDGKVDFNEFKLGRLIDKLKDQKWPGGIKIKPVPMPMPKIPEGGIKPVPMPMPKFSEDGIKPVPMPSPKIDGSIFQAGGVTVSDLVSKVKQAQEGLPKDEI